MKHAWTPGAVVYQIYPRSFQDSNGDGIGDIKGVIQRLDYLASLGIDAVWFSPIYPSPQADFGYDIADYTSLDPVYGDLEIFDELIKNAHARGIKILMDFVPNHSSDKHPWFTESRSSKFNPKRDWYIWKDPKPDGSPPNNWESVFGGPAWELDKKTNQYYLHTFVKEQPDLNWRNPEVVQAMFDVLRFWMKKGVDGFRVDAFDWVFNDPDYLDERLNPRYKPEKDEPSMRLLHVRKKTEIEMLDMLKKMTNVLKEFDHRFMVIEVHPEFKSLLRMYHHVDWQWFAPFNFQFILHPWKAAFHKKLIDKFETSLDTHHLPCYAIGNHDRSRVASRIGEGQARVAAMLLLTLRGISFIYNGEEIGMTDTPIPEKYIHDPYAINFPERGVGRDPERTPMQWDNSKNAGFTTGKPWLPVNENKTHINVKDEEKDPVSFLALYRKLLKLKQHRKALHEGYYTPLVSPAKNVFAFLRETTDETILVLLNFDNKNKKFNLDYSGTLLCDAKLTEPENKKINLQNFILPGDQGYIIKL